MSIIPQNGCNVNEENDYINTINNFFSTFKVPSLIKKCNFVKTKGVSCLTIMKYLFTLVFHHKSIYRDLSTSEKGFKEDTVYDFLKSVRYNWSKLLGLLSSVIINDKLNGLTNKKREKVFIVDDSIYERNSSKKVELLSRVHDHNGNEYKLGYQMLTLTWTDGNSTIPVGFNLVASNKDKNLISGEDEEIDKRTNGYKRRLDAKKSKPELMMQLLDIADKYKIKADFMLFDSWFAYPSTLLKLLKRNLHTIAMLKATTKIHYVVNGLHRDIKQIYNGLTKLRRKGDIIKSIDVYIEDKENDNQRVPVRLVFVRNRNKKNDWLSLISTDTSISAEEIVRIYGKRWNIEVFFKTCKSYLKLAKETQVRSYDSLVAHTSIVFMRYMMLSIDSRNNADDKTLGALFYDCCDEMQDIKLMDSLRLILTLLKETLNEIFIDSIETFNAIYNVFLGKLSRSIKEKLIISFSGT